MRTAVGLGIAAAILAAIAYQLGLVIEKRALGRLPAIDPRRPASMVHGLLSSPGWLAGFALMLCGLGLQVVSLTLAPITVVQPVQAAGVVILLVASRLALRERLRAAESTGVLLIAASVAAIALSASGTPVRAGVQVNPAALAVVAASTLLAGALLGARALRLPRSVASWPARPVPFGISAGLFYGVAALAIKGLSAILLHPRPGLAMVLAILASPYLYVLGGSSAAGMVLFQTGLQRCKVSLLWPVSNLTGSGFFLIAGSWLFGEQLPADPARLALRLAGIGTAAAVVTMLSCQGPGRAPVHGAHRRTRGVLRRLGTTRRAPDTAI